MTTLTEYERGQLAAISAWKKERPGVMSRAFGVVISPLTWLVQMAVPEAVARRAVDTASELGQLMTDSADVLRDAHVSELPSLRGKDLELCDGLADNVHNWAVGVAVAEGAAAGVVGIFSAPIDVPAIIVLAMRTIHKVGICYGYECKTTEDQQFARGILAAAGALTIEEKAVALAALTSLRVVLIRQTWTALAQRVAQRPVAESMKTMALYELAAQVGITIVRSRALAAIPVVGATVGGFANGRYIKRVGWAARRAFQERWLADSGRLEPDGGSA